MASSQDTNFYDVIHALEDVIASSDVMRRKILAQKIDAYAETFPEEYLWAIGGLAPTLLNSLVVCIHAASRAPAPASARVDLRIVAPNAEK